MATCVEFIEYVCEQIHGNYAVKYRKMFGDYMVYVNDKPVLLVCDNTVYVKKLTQLSDLLQDADCGIPYDGSKEHYILDIDNVELVGNVIQVMEIITPLPKKKQSRK